MVLRLILGVTLVAMAAGQLASWPDVPDILAAYQLADGSALPLLAALLIAGELLAGGWFLARPRSRAAAPVWVYTAVAVAWAGLAGQAYARGLTVPNCGCFGVYLSQSLNWFVLLQDALLLAYAAVLIRGIWQPAPDLSGRSCARSRSPGVPGRSVDCHDGL